MGETPIRMLELARSPSAAVADELAGPIEFNLENPARELMGGAPGTLLAALFLQRRTGDVRCKELFRRTAARLRRN